MSMIFAAPTTNIINTFFDSPVNDTDDDKHLLIIDLIVPVTISKTINTNSAISIPFNSPTKKLIPPTIADPATCNHVTILCQSTASPPFRNMDYCPVLQ